MRSRSWLAAVTVMTAVLLFPMPERLSAQSSTGIMISEFRFRGPAGANDEFVELFNAGPAAVDIGGWLIRASDNPAPNPGPIAPTIQLRVMIPFGTVIEPGCHYLVTNANSNGGYTGGVAGDRTYNTGFNDDGGVAVTREDLSIVDQVGHGPFGGFGEGTRLPTLLTDVNRGVERDRSATTGHLDTDDNLADFSEVAANPESASSPCFAPAPVVLLPHEIQGSGATSPLANGTTVMVRGVVTARKADGFFLQTETGMEDADPNTSEGLFVFANMGAPDEAQVGHLIEVTGSVSEFVPGEDPASAPRTQLNLAPPVADLGAATLPAPYELTSAEVSATGSLDQLERFEGMRVMIASLTSVTGTGGENIEAEAMSMSDGTFYAVLTGQARPFRQSGVPAGDPVLPCAVGPCQVPVFDGNPERLRVDSDALEGTAAAEISSGAVMTDVVGALDFELRTYTLLPDATLMPAGGLTVIAAPGATPNQFTVGSFNLQRFFDVSSETRMSKASLTIRTILNNPDILGVQEVENLSVLQQLAARIDADALASGTAAPGYAAYLVDGSDPEGLDVGLLVKTTGGRVSVTSVDPIGDSEMFERPPLVLRAVVQGPTTSFPQPVTVIVNDLRSRAGVGSDDETGAAVRALRRAQAEFIAAYIQGRQQNDPGEAIVALGGYNAFGFNDGYVDTVGTILGAPAPEDQVALASPDLVTPNLVNLADFIAASARYGSLDRGNAQALDHVLVTGNLTAQFATLMYARVNADFPESMRGDPAIPQRLSDRDPVVAYFAFRGDTQKPVFSGTPADQIVEAISAAGASVTYTAPTATDNLDGDVAVACEPSSGATHPLGNTGVTCTAADAAGNVASVSFSVTVRDLTAPELSVPANITEPATSATGRVVTFTAFARDAVTESPTVTCAPASGATFAVGVTTVNCSAADAARNLARASFTVTITALPVTPPATSAPGRMNGEGTIGSGRSRTMFALDVRESALHVDRGWLVLKVGRNYFAAAVSNVTFTNTPGFALRPYARSGNASVSFAGSGWWNGRPGYSFEATATDQSRSGRTDTFTYVVRRHDGSVVASGEGTLTSGNLHSSR